MAPTFAPTDTPLSTTRPRRRLAWSFAGLALLLLGVAVLLSSCASTVPTRDAVGERFVEVRGESLDGAVRTVPSDFAGEPLIVLVGYVQDAQFDCDRWLLGLAQLGTPARLVELPTIRGMVPGMFAGSIDDGMRSGIPEEDWGTVLTLYGDDADAVVEQFGNERPRNARVVLLDRDGTVRWQHARGYSAGKVRELDAAVRALGS